MKPKKKHRGSQFVSHKKFLGYHDLKHHFTACDPYGEPLAERCRQLWFSVLMQAFSDLTCSWDNHYAQAAHRRMAHGWFKSRNFALVCDFSGLVPQVVMDIYKKYFDNSENLVHTEKHPASSPRRKPEKKPCQPASKPKPKSSRRLRLAFTNSTTQNLTEALPA